MAIMLIPQGMAYSMLARLPAEIVRIVDRGGERSLHLLRPIRILPPCLACHGEPAAYRARGIELHPHT